MLKKQFSLRRVILLLALALLMICIPGAAFAADKEKDVYDEKAMKEKLAVAHRILAGAGHDDWIWGHASVRVPGTDTFWMKPSGLGLEEITADSLILVDLEGNVIGGSGLPRHSEYPIHSEIYRARPDVNCVIHTHPTYATMLTATKQMILPLTHDGALFVDDQAYYDLTSGLIRTKEAGKTIADSLGKNRILFMRNHGTVVVGKTIEEATGAAICMERAAFTQITAMATGQDLVSSTAKEVADKKVEHFRPSFFTGLFEYLKRKL